MGYYVARQLSMKEVRFEMQEVEVDPEFQLMYDEGAKLVSCFNSIQLSYYVREYKLKTQIYNCVIFFTVSTFSGS